MQSWKIPEFYSVGGACSKNSFFAFLGYPSTILRTAYRKQFYPKPMVPMESRDSEGVPLASVESLWPGICNLAGWRVPKSGHVITKIENLHIGACRKIHWFQKCNSFQSTTKNNEVLAEKPFPNSGGACGSLAARRQYNVIFLVHTCKRDTDRHMPNNLRCAAVLFSEILEADYRTAVNYCDFWQRDVFGLLAFAMEALMLASFLHSSFVFLRTHSLTGPLDRRRVVDS